MIRAKEKNKTFSDGASRDLLRRHGHYLRRRPSCPLKRRTEFAEHTDRVTSGALRAATRDVRGSNSGRVGQSRF